jgi:hypothetical protein
MPRDPNASEERDSRQRLQDLHDRLTALLDELDEAELHGPAAHISMALDTMRRQNPGLSGRR